MSPRAMGKRAAPLTELPTEFTQAHRFGKNSFGSIHSSA